MSEKEQIIALKAQNELLKSQLKNKDEELKSTIVEKTTIKDQLAQKDEQFKKLGVSMFLRSTIEMYELILANFSSSANLRDMNSNPPDLDTLNINLSDSTVKSTYYLHYNRWMNILHSSIDPRMVSLRNEINALFNSFSTFSRYIALLFIHISNIIHNIPSDMLIWENEDEVVQALQAWRISDPLELTVCRIVYRIPHIQ